MPGIESLIQVEQDETISFGNYSLNEKSKKQDFEHQGDLYKVKTFYEITKLERNGMFVYESVPGTTVENLKVTDKGCTCVVKGDKDAQLTIQLEDDTDYEVFVDGMSAGDMKTNMSGKLVVSVELGEGSAATIRVEKR